MKYHDQNPASFSVSTTGSIQNLINVNAQGTGDFQERIGDQISLKHITVSCTLAKADATNYFRLVLFSWFADNNVDAPALLSILNAGIVTSPYNWDLIHARKFKVHYSKVIPVNDISRPSVPVLIRKKLNHKIRFNGGTSTGRGILYLLFLTDSSATPHPTVTDLYSRITYQDA